MPDAPYLRIVIAQINPTVGDVAGNTRLILAQAHTAKTVHHADLIVFPELTLSGYPPQDLLFREDVHHQIDQARQYLCSALQLDAIIGYPEQTPQGCYNTAIYLRQGHIIARYRKQALPCYGVFDEPRYFISGDECALVHVKGIPIALSICEDLWQPAPIEGYIKAGARMIISLNASPFSHQKAQKRTHHICKQATYAKIPIVYANLVGGQDALIFDGGSFVVDGQGHLVAHAPFFEEHLLPVDVHLQTHRFKKGPPPPVMDPCALMYHALVLGLKDYVHKHAIKGVVLGLSGGIDSALTAAIAVDALGASCVTAVMMPSPYTRPMSIEDAKLQANNLNIPCEILPIHEVYQQYLQTLKPCFSGFDLDTTEENIQARCRATLLMAIANKKHLLLLSTSNKSEAALGYTTLYGDMAGGFAVLKDVSKTWVYRLAQYRNGLNPVIPHRVITRPPSAELAPNQEDQDHLPPYEVIDAVLTGYMEHKHSVAQIAQTTGLSSETIRGIIHRILRHEHKRRQGPLGPRVTEGAFGVDYLYPITSAYLD